MRYIDYSPMYYHSSIWSGGIIPVIINILFWTALIALGIMIVKKMSLGAHHGCCVARSLEEEKKDDTYYLDIVKERYAKGEIDRKQFEELKKDLSLSEKEESK